MRRLGGVLLALALTAACTPETTEKPPERIASLVPSIASPIGTPTPEETLDPVAACDGFGRPRPTGEVTYLDENKLLAVDRHGDNSRCLADLTDSDVQPEIPRPIQWNAPGDRVLVDNRAISKDLTATDQLTSENREVAQWSRPTGTSVVYVTRDGRLHKTSSFGNRSTDISFLERHDDVVYHPAGTHIATTGLAADGDYGLYLATNVGTEPQLLAIGEEARFLTNLEFTQDGRYLYYTARHGPENWHLHRLLIGDDPALETLAKGKADFAYAVSPFDSFRVAWFQPGDCAAGVAGTFKAPRYARLQIPDDFRDADLVPIGWLPRGELVVARRPLSCGTGAPRDVYVLSRRDPVLITRADNGSAAVRVELPPPPPPPGEEQEVVA